jgi:RNA polymerase sigma-70 factor (ECF subfamily)
MEATRDFTAMASSLAPELERFISNLLRGDPDRVRDLVQDTLLAAWRHLGDLRRPELLRAWIYRVAYRNAMSSLRRRGPRGRAILLLGEGVAEEIRSPVPVEARGWRVAGDWADAEELSPRLRTELAELPPRLARPLELRYLESLGIAETARTLGIRISTLKMRLHRGRELLRHRLTMAERERRFRAPPGNHGVSLGRPPPPPLPRPPPPAPPTRPTVRIARKGAS